MRYYLIRNAGAEVRRKRPTAVEEGDLVVTSAIELDEARLPAKQLLGLLNNLTSESRTKLGDRKKGDRAALDRFGEAERPGDRVVDEAGVKRPTTIQAGSGH